MATVQSANTTQNDPIYSLPFLYISGLNISVASTTIIAIAPGQARDSNDNIDMPVGFPNLQGDVEPSVYIQDYRQPLLLNSAVTGANGLDRGTLAASSSYCVWLIGDSRGYKPVAGLISLSSNAYPLMPLGYDSLRLLGFVTTSAGTAFQAASLLNTAYSKAYYLQPPVSEVAAGNATTFTAVDLASSIPTTTSPFVIAFLLVTFTPAAAASNVQFRPTGSTATTNLVTISAISAGVPQQQYVQVICGVSGGQPSIDYKVTSASDAVTVLVTGYAVTLA
jgi:hypothetical protein